MSTAYERIKKLLEQAGNGTGGIYQGTGGPTQEQIARSADSAIFRREEIAKNAEIGAQVRQFNKTYTPAPLLPSERIVTVDGKTFTGAQADRVKALADKYNQTIKNPNATPVELFFAQKNLNDALGRPTPDLQNTIADRYQSQGEAEGDKYIMQAMKRVNEGGRTQAWADNVNNNRFREIVYEEAIKAAGKQIAADNRAALEKSKSGIEAYLPKTSGNTVSRAMPGFNANPKNNVTAMPQDNQPLYNPYRPTPTARPVNAELAEKVKNKEETINTGINERAADTGGLPLLFYVRNLKAKKASGEITEYTPNQQKAIEEYNKGLKPVTFREYNNARLEKESPIVRDISRGIGNVIAVPAATLIETGVDILRIAGGLALEGVGKANEFFGDPIKKETGDAIFNLGKNLIANALKNNELVDASKDYYIGRDQTFFEQIVGSASQMIMTIIVSQVLAAWKYGLQGLNALETAEKAAKFTQAGQMAILGATSGKSGASEAYAEGATEGQALLYGLASGMLEVMTENIANGIPGFETVDEGELIRKISNLLSKNPKVASYIEKGLNIVGEGNEEVINALVTPWIKRAIYNSSAPGTTIDELAKAFVGGAIMSVMISGGYGAIEYAENTIEKVRAATIAGDPAASTDTKFQAAIQVAQQEAAPADVSGAEVVTRVNDALGQKLGKEAVEAAARVYESDTFRADVKQAIEQTAQLQMTEEEIAAGIELVQTMDIDSIPRDFAPEQINKVLQFGEILNGLAEKTVDAMLESDTTKTRDPANYKYEPYTEGPVPQTTNAEAAETVVLPPAETVAIAVQIQNAKAEAHRDGKSEKGTLKDVAKQVFSSKYGDSLTAVVKSTNFEGKPYKVIAYKGVSGEIVNNRIATLQDVIAVSKIKEIIENGNYVGSKKSELKGTRNSEAIRYDYFTTQIKIGSKIYSANWDVKVFPESNQYYIHRINSITLKENSGSDAYVEGAKYVPAAARNPNSGTIISNPAQNVNTLKSTDYGKSIYPIPADFKASNYLLLTKNMLL